MDPKRRNAIVSRRAAGCGHSNQFRPAGGGRPLLPEISFLSGDESEPPIRALRANGTDVITAAHSHMLDDQPRLFSCISGATTTH
jgi:hypothetical protein